MANKLSRRDMLKGLGLGALSLGTVALPVASTMAQTTAAPGPLGAVFNFKIGEWDATIIKDGNGQTPLNILAVNQEEGTAEALYDSLNLSNDGGTFTNLFDILVLRTGEQTILFDTGFGPGAGALVPTLEQALGVTTADVTHVVISHWHPDHINGLSNDDGLVYPNAEVLFPEPEMDFLTNAAPENMAAGPLGKLQPAMDADQLTMYSDGTEIITGLTAMHTPGHTPGHMALMFENGGDRLINTVDSIFNPIASVPNPNWHLGFDADGAQAEETRRMLLDMIASESMTMFGYHFPFPGMGVVVAEGDSYRFYPTAY
jgi:glyoxylase-like metal-dependent hydrolase (beta-lactamase superfamily II)